MGARGGGRGTNGRLLELQLGRERQGGRERAAAGEGLAGRNLVNSGIRKNLRCNVVAVKTASGEMLINPDPLREFQSADELFLIGDAASETAFYETYWPDRGLRIGDQDSFSGGDVSHEPGHGWFA